MLVLFLNHKNFINSLKHPEVVKIILFGSVARGDDTVDFDIDILIVTNKKSDKQLILD
ncbi:MAG: nucleotidyltransferase domain-containing protein [Methanobrevibacter sp.]|nr:nucleotidyltransferase domain-containing protein [Candidatus Methanoflexus mossambicus]